MNLLFQKVTFQDTTDPQLLRLSAHLQSHEYFSYHTLGVRTATLHQESPVSPD